MVILLKCPHDDTFWNDMDKSKSDFCLTAQSAQGVDPLRGDH